MSESSRNLVSHAKFQIGQIDHLLTAYADLLSRARQCPPDLIEVTAIGSVLHSFYNGVESIFLSIARELDGQVPDGPQWHRDLLIQMTRPTGHRGEVISADLALRLTSYLGFRHFYRHSYSFFLEWDKLSSLVEPLSDVWADVKRAVLESLDSVVPADADGRTN